MSEPESITAAANGFLVLPDYQMTFINSSCEWAFITNSDFIIQYCHKSPYSADDILPQNLIGFSIENFLPENARDKVMPLLRASARQQKSQIETVYSDRLTGLHQLKCLRQSQEGDILYFVSIEHISKDGLAELRKELYGDSAQTIEQQVSKQLDQQMLITSLSKEFVKKSKDSIDELFAFALKELGNFLEVDRCSVFKHDLEKRTYGVLYEWCAEKVPSTKEILQNIPYNDSDEGFIQLTTRPYIAVDDTFQFEGEAYKVQRESGVHSFADIPILVNGSFWGFLGADYGSGPHYWTDSEFHMLQTISSLLSSVIENHEMELQLHEAVEKAEEANRAKSEFFSRMSHEIRTPMNAVRGLGELLSLTEMNDVQRNYLDNIIIASNSLLNIIDDILDFSKISADRIEFVEEEYEIKELLASVVNVVNVRAEDKGLLFKVDASPDLPSSFFGDEFRVKQILTNILTNATKYTHEGFVILSISLEEAQAEDVQAEDAVLVCSVTDSGVGIKEEEIPTLFDAFSRADLHANRNIAGTGLGLSITKQLALAMGGSVEVQSVYGKGSTFTVRLPQKVVKSEPIAKVASPSNKRVLLLGTGLRSTHILSMLAKLDVQGNVLEIQGEALELLDAESKNVSDYTHCIFSNSVPQSTVISLRNKMPLCRFAVLKDINHASMPSGTHEAVLYTPLFVSSLAHFINQPGRTVVAKSESDSASNELVVHNAAILVVDDNEVNRLICSEMLGIFGVQAVCVEDGYKAIELCNKQAFDLIFMDHMMPGLDGVETTNAIRSGNGQNSAIPILALTANVANDMKTLYLENGMNDCLAKPIELSDLRNALISWLPKERFEMAFRNN